jgi:hypothetical protein
MQLEWTPGIPNTIKSNERWVLCLRL